GRGQPARAPRAPCAPRGGRRRRRRAPRGRRRPRAAAPGRPRRGRRDLRRPAPPRGRLGARGWNLPGAAHACRCRMGAPGAGACWARPRGALARLGDLRRSGRARPAHGARRPHRHEGNTVSFTRDATVPAGGLEPVSNERLARLFDENGTSYGTSPDGELGGFWDDHLFTFWHAGKDSEFFQVRGRWTRGVPESELDRVLRLLN